MAESAESRMVAMEKEMMAIKELLTKMATGQTIIVDTVPSTSEMATDDVGAEEVVDEVAEEEQPTFLEEENATAEETEGLTEDTEDEAPDCKRSKSDNPPPSELLAELKKSREKPTVSQALDGELAEHLQHLVQHGLPDKKRQEIEEKYLPPSNCGIAAVVVNDEILRLLPANLKNADGHLAKQQATQAKGLMAMAQALDTVKKACDEVPDLNKAFACLLDSFALLATQNKKMNDARRARIRPELKTTYRHLCNSDQPITTKLFGDKLDEALQQQHQANKIRLQVGAKREFPKTATTQKPYGKTTFTPRPYTTQFRFQSPGQTYAARGRGRGSAASRGSFASTRGRFPRMPAKTTQQVKEQFLAGNIKSHVREWRKITSDPVILDTVKHCHLEFVHDIPSSNINLEPYAMNSNERQSVNLELNKFLTKGVVREVKLEEVKFLSNVFVRPKKDGTHRVILNLNKLNQSIDYKKFKMETLKSIISLMRPNCFMGSIDLKDAYYTVPVALAHQGFLCFPWADETGVLKYYAYTCLPNGLTSAPRLFTKLLKPALSFLRTQGITIAMYIDDSFIQAGSYDECFQHVQVASETLKSLGFIINNDKSVMTPTQKLSMLGFILDSVDMLVKPTSEKATKVVNMFKESLLTERISIRKVAQLIGNIVGLFPGVEFGELHYRQLERLKVEGLQANKGSFDAVVALTDECKAELQWWIDNLHNAKKPISRGPPNEILRTDASNDGWGAVKDGVATGGRWSETELSLHINCQEMKAVLLGLQSLCKNTTQKHIRLEIDNSTAVAYINSMGGMVSRACDLVAKDTWQWAMERENWISAVHIPGVNNVEADYMSRVFEDRTEWMLDSKVFQNVCECLGEPKVDLFASRLNAQLPRYVSWRPDPEAMDTDAFALSWEGELNYIFPPFSLINRCLQKLELEEASAIMIAPIWPTQCWFPVLLRLLTAHPLVLPAACLTLPQGSKTELPRAKLMACQISGLSSKRVAFQQGLPRLSSVAGNLALSSSTRQCSKDGESFVVNGRSLILKHLSLLS